MKIDTLQEAVALPAKTIAGRETPTPRKHGRRNRCLHVVKESSDEESSSSEEEEEEPTPSTKPKRKAKKTQRSARDKAKASISFDVDGPYKPGMQFKPEWLQRKKAAYLAARKRYHRTGTKEAPTDKVSGMKAMLQKWKTTDANEDKIAELEAVVGNWEAKRTKREL